MLLKFPIKKPDVRFNRKLNKFLKVVNNQTSHITDQIRKRRIELAYSQEYMAAKLGCSQKGYSKIELGNVKLTVDYFLRVCNLLDISPACLIELSLVETALLAI